MAWFPNKCFQFNYDSKIVLFLQTKNITMKFLQNTHEHSKKRTTYAENHETSSPVLVLFLNHTGFYAAIALTCLKR